MTSSAVVCRGLLGLVSLLAAVLCWTPQRTPHRCTRCTRWIDCTACPLLSTADCRLQKALQRYYLNVEECRFTRSSVRLAAANVVHYVPCLDGVEEDERGECVKIEKRVGDRPIRRSSFVRVTALGFAIGEKSTPRRLRAHHYGRWNRQKNTVKANADDAPAFPFTRRIDCSVRVSAPAFNSFV